VSQELLDRAYEDNFLKKNIITGDETWVYGYDVEKKVKSSQWVSKTSSRPKKISPRAFTRQGDADGIF